MSEPTLKIAVIDTEPHIMKTVTELLTGDGHHVHVYPNTPDVHQLLRIDRPDLIILSIAPMAIAQGWEILELLCYDSATATIPVIVCTTTRTTIRGQAERLVELHAIPLERPFTDQTLREALAQALRHAGRQGIPPFRSLRVGE